MNILVLSKRQYTGKDLINDRYGRLYEIPASLAARGHVVKGIALSYRRKDEGWHEWADSPGIRWYAINAIPFGIWRYIKAIKGGMNGFRPDIIWASSDTIHAFLGWLLSRYFGCALVVDLYDNYESFLLNKIPGMNLLLRHVCRQADGISVVSESLKKFVLESYSFKRPCIVVRNGISEFYFHPMNKTESRAYFDFPFSAKVMGTAGAINKNRGIDDLFLAFLHLAKQDGNLWLFYAGPCDKTPKKYQHARIRYLGNLNYNDVARFYSALDVAVICNRNSEFGKFCFPQKFYEILAVKTPLVAARVGGVVDILADHEEYLYPPGDNIALAEKISSILTNTSELSTPVVNWKSEAEKLERFFIYCSENNESLH